MTKSVNADEKAMRVEAGMRVNDVLAHISYHHASDNEYFGHMSEFISSLLALGLMLRFKSEADFRERLRDYLDITRDEEIQDDMWAKVMLAHAANADGCL